MASSFHILTLMYSTSLHHRRFLPDSFVVAIVVVRVKTAVVAVVDEDGRNKTVSAPCRNRPMTHLC